MKKILVIVDMVNGFLKEGPLADKKIMEIVPNVQNLLENVKFDKVICFRDAHKKDDEEFKTFPPHCLKGTRESALIDELLPYSKKFIDIEKQTTNGYETTTFKIIWKKLKKETGLIVVVGCCTDICVKNFCNSILKDKENFTKIVIPDDCVSTFNGEGHNAKDVQEKALDELKKNGAIIIESKKKLKVEEK